MTWSAIAGVSSWCVDYEAGKLELVMTDGRIARRRTRGRVTDFKRVLFRAQELTLEMVTPSDEVLIVEVYASDDQEKRRAGRPVVYLDQNKWIQLAQSIHRPERVPRRELEPARRLVELARSGDVILPISSGHWVETSPTYGHRRTRLASVMVGLSRGWIMRDPLRVRFSELTTMFAAPRHADGASDQPPVFTLDHRQVRAEAWEPHVPTDDQMPPELVEVIDVLGGSQAVLAVLLEDERTPRQSEMAARWAELHQVFAQHLADEPAARADLRTLTLFRFIADLGTDLIEIARAAGFTPADYAQWVQEHADSQIAALPYIGRYREIIHLRLQDPRKQWTANDLIDLLYLPCAAAYADFVICEKHLGHYLGRCAPASEGGAVVVTSVAGLMERLG